MRRMAGNVADALRKWGVKVVEVDGWQTRGWKVSRGGQRFDPQGVVDHHTANGGFRGVDAPALQLCVNGRPPSKAEPNGLPGPLCQIVLGYSGTAYLIAAFGANHAGSGGWRGLSGNGSVWGIEAENNGVGEPWPQAQLDAFVRCNAALAEFSGFGPEMCCGHKEWTRQKIDPAGIDMNDFRSKVAALLARKPNTPAAEPDELPTIKRRHMFDSLTFPAAHPTNPNCGLEVQVAFNAVFHRWQNKPGEKFRDFELITTNKAPFEIAEVHVRAEANGSLDVVIVDVEGNRARAWQTREGTKVAWQAWAAA